MPKKNELIKKIANCRVCKGNDLSRVLTLGPTPLANAFLNKNQIDREEYFYPLDVYFCNNCTFLTLGHVVSPEELFGNYVYVSSTSPVFVRHFEEMAADLVPRFKLVESLVVDVGSNDGILLKPFKKMNATVLGIEPAAHIATLAKKNGIPTIPDWFTKKIAAKIVKEKGRAKLATATNVFAHIDDLDEVISALQILLDHEGVFVMEAPYLVDFLEKRYFDLVYHEHLSYWAVGPLITLFKRFNMVVFDVQKVPVHGGTIRVFVKKDGASYRVEKSVKDFLEMEKKANLKKIETYQHFAELILQNKVNLLSLVSKLKSQGKRIAAYGAPAKGNTLLNFFSIGLETLDYVVDDSLWKQNLFTPGKRIPVVSSKHVYKDQVDYLLILAWNFAESIMKNHEQFKKQGGRFIIPVPIPIVV